MAESPAQVWDAEADGFDDEPDHGLRDPVTRRAWRALMLDVLPPSPARVADLGCGTGSLATLLAAEGYDVVGLDVSPRMLDIARAKADAADVQVRFVLGDGNAPDLEAGAFDVVLDRHVLWAMTDPAQALRRWTELLAPGGRLVLVEGRWHTGAGLTTEETVDLVTSIGWKPEARDLPDPDLWGGPTGDHRYLVVATRPSTAL